MTLPRVPVLGGIVLVLVAVAALAWALTAKEPPSPPVPLGTPGFVVGVTANALDGGEGQLLPAVQQAGIGWLREEFRWSKIEPRQGVFDYRRYDALVADAARRGQRVLPLLIQSPAWLYRDPLAIPRPLRLWKRFVTRVVGRYNRDGAFWRAHPKLDRRLAPETWEIWNEPYLSAFSAGGVAPAAYANLVAASVQAGRRVDPRSKWLMAAESDYQAADGAKRQWLPDLFAARPDLGRYVDAIAVHPYSQGGPLDERGDPDGRFSRLETISSTLTSLGVPGRPLWLTEMGWSTCTEEPPCVPEATQAKYWRQALEQISERYRGLVDAVFVYRFSDYQGKGPGDSQARFGIVRRNLGPKPALRVISRAARESR